MGACSMSVKVSLFSPSASASIVDHDMVAGLVFAAEQPLAQFILHPALQQPAQRAGAVARIIADLGDVVGRRLGQLHREAQLVHALADILHQQHDDLPDLLAVKRLEDDGLVDPVEELGPEESLQLVAILALRCTCSRRSRAS